MFDPQPYPFVEIDREIFSHSFHCLDFENIMLSNWLGCYFNIYGVFSVSHKEE